jgi:uncharacterized membrane protein
MTIQLAINPSLPADRLASGWTLSRWKAALRRRVLHGRPATVHFASVGALTTLFAVFYSIFDLVLYATFRESSYDLVIFDQAVRSYSHFQPGISIIKGVHNGFGPHFSILGDHFSPIIATLAPLYWLHDGPQTLLVAQGLLFAIAIPPLWVFTRRAFGGGRSATIAAYLVSVAYGLSWPVAAALFFDFHEAAFAPVIIAVALERIQAGRLRGTLIALAALLMVKADMGLLVAGIGLYLAVSRARTLPRQRLLAGALLVGGISFTAVAVYVLIPAFGGRSNYYWAYGALGSNVPQVLGYIVSHPLSTLHLMISPSVKLRTMGWLVAAFCFLPLLSPITLAAIPLLAERMLAKSHNWWSTHFQYNAFLVMILVCGAVDGAARLQRWVSAYRRLAGARNAAATSSAELPAVAGVLDAAVPATPREAPASHAARQPAASAEPGTAPPHASSSARHFARGPSVFPVACAVALCAVAVAIVPTFPFGLALHSQFYQQTPRSRAAAAADAVVPNGVVVEAANNVGPQLSGRDTVLMWDGEHPPLGSPWIVADVAHTELTFKDVRAERARVTELRAEGYKIVFERRGFIVLHRGGRRVSAHSEKAVS